MFYKTSKLPKVDIVKTHTIISKNTVSAIQAGIFYGYIGQVEYIVKHMKEEINEKDIKVIATGGLSNLIVGESPLIDIVNDLLTLEGLKIIYDKNR